MATLQQSASGKKDGDIRYLTPLNIETNKQKYCFKKSESNILIIKMLISY
jgi:small subunit ribosomal protein S18